MKRLEEQVAIVTGGARGIGRGIAEVLAEEGAAVVVADLDEEGAAKTAAELAGEATAVTVEVTDRSSVEAMAAAAIERFGRIDILAANAGIYPIEELAEINDAAWDRVMGVNAKGAFLTVQAVQRRMTEQGYGRIVMTSSITGPVTGHPGLTHYGASKAAMVGFMRSAAIELARDGVTINAVLPGNVNSPGQEELGEAHRREMMAAIPMNDFGDCRDVAWAVRFLASPEARFITGQTLIVDGGQVLPETQDALQGR